MLNKEMLGEELRKLADVGIADFKKCHPFHNVSTGYSHARIFDVEYVMPFGICWDCRHGWHALPGLSYDA